MFKKKRVDIRICIADSLCYKAETNTPLYSNHTPIKVSKNNNKKIKNKNCIYLRYTI